MGSPYTSTTPSGYNSNPPADDGSSTAANQVKWSTIKTKLSDPLNTFASSINSALVAAFAKVVGGAGVTSTGVDYTVTTSDQGKLIRATASGITITTADATSVGAPFVHALLNNSSGSITLEGNGSQNIDGNANITVSSGTGFMLYTDGTDWFTTGRLGTLAGAQLMSGDIINGTIVESNSINAVTFAVKTLAGNDPSSNDPVLVCFRNSSLGTGTYVYRTITSATSLTISSGSTLGATSNVAFKVWLVLFDDAGTIRLGAINTLSGTSVYPLGHLLRASSTAEGGAGAADSAHVFYTGTAVSSKSYAPLGYCSYDSGLATAGTWNVSPTRIQLYGAGVPLPGQIIQTQVNFTGSSTTGTTVIPNDNTIPQNTEGDQYMSQAITPTSASNVLAIQSKAHIAHSAGSGAILAITLFQDLTANALAVTTYNPANNNYMVGLDLKWRMVAGTTSSTTLKVRGGSDTAGTTTFNGAGGAQKYNGTVGSFIEVQEIMT